MNRNNQAGTTSKLEDFKVRWLGYIVASIFLYIEGNRLGNVPIMVIGILTGVAALFIILGMIPHEGLRKATNYVDETFQVPLKIIVLIGLIKGIFELIEVTGTAVWIWVLLIILLGYISFDIIIIVRNMKNKATLIGWKPTLIRQCKILSFVLILFVFVMLVTNVQGFGAPYIWLGLGIVAQVTALTLEGVFKKVHKQI